MSKKRILIAYHMELLYVGLKSLLEQCADFDVVAQAKSNVEILHYAEQYSPELLLVDIDSIAFDGIVSIEKLKNENQETKILAMTDRLDADVVSDCLAAGADGVCLKSIKPTQLISALQSLDTGCLWIDARLAAKIKEFMAKKAPVKPASVAQTSVGAMFQSLSKREMEVLELLVRGLTNTQIADQLRLSGETVKTHVRHIYEKLSVKHRAEAVVTAIKLGLVCAA